MSDIISVYEYTPFLRGIKNDIHQAKVRAARLVSRELTQLYWTIGEKIVEAQKKHGWGKSIVEMLARDLKELFPGAVGFSSRNLWAMRQFFLEYVDLPTLQPLVFQIPWAQNVEIMSRVKEEDARYYYLNGTVEMGWTRAVLIVSHP